jgi:phosphoserine phosphatase RsbU/P
MAERDSGMKILIADDDFTTRIMLQTVLSKCGYEVALAVDGNEAWIALQEADAPQLAVLDWMMPGLDGVEVCQHVRAIETDRPPYLILLTTCDKKEQVVAGLRAGADDYLVKPYDPQELSARVEVGRRVVEMQARLADKIQELREALEQIRTLRGIVPICSNCKKIRDDQGYWTQVEVYVRNHSEAEFSHGICPDCAKILYPEFRRRQ